MKCLSLKLVSFFWYLLGSTPCVTCDLSGRQGNSGQQGTSAGWVQDPRFFYTKFSRVVDLADGACELQKSPHECLRGGTGCLILGFLRRQPVQYTRFPLWGMYISKKLYWFENIFFFRTTQERGTGLGLDRGEVIWSRKEGNDWLIRNGLFPVHPWWHGSPQSGQLCPGMGSLWAELKLNNLSDHEILLSTNLVLCISVEVTKCVSF